MELIADILLATGAFGAGFYCFVLGRRLKKFNDLRDGVGGAVAVLSAQVDDLTKTLATAQTAASGSAHQLTQLTTRAEEISRQLELQIASMHDISEPVQPQKTTKSVHETAKNTQSEPMFMRRRDLTGAA